MKTTTTTDTATLLRTARETDHARRVKAVHEFTRYRLLRGGDLLNVDSGVIYSRVGSSGCSCPDFQFQIAPLRAQMLEAGETTLCCCKHLYAARLLEGKSVWIDNLVFRAGKK